MKLLSVRWLFLLAAVAGVARCVLSGATPPRLAFACACGLLWFWLSQRKVHSLDRESLGVPPRR